jgi:hypothetical protein
VKPVVLSPAVVAGVELDGLDGLDGLVELVELVEPVDPLAPAELAEPSVVLIVWESGAKVAD